MTILLYKHLGALRPADEHAEEVIKKLTQGEAVTCEIKKARNIKFHRLYWKLMSVVAGSLPDEYSPEVVSDLVKIHTGFFTPAKTKEGIIRLPKSISFAAMSEPEFKEFFQRATVWICSELLPAINSDDLNREIFDLIQ